LQNIYNVHIDVDGYQYGQGFFKPTELSNPTGNNALGFHFYLKYSNGILNSILVNDGPTKYIPYRLMGNMDWGSGCWNCRAYHTSTVSLNGKIHNLKFRHFWNKVSDPDQIKFNSMLQANIERARNTVTTLKTDNFHNAATYVDSRNGSKAAAAGKITIEAEIKKATDTNTANKAGLVKLKAESKASLKSQSDAEVLLANLKKRQQEIENDQNTESGAIKSNDELIVSLKKSLTDGAKQISAFEEKAKKAAVDFHHGQDALRVSATGDNATAHIDAATKGFNAKNKATVNKNLNLIVS